jgi:CubicO group peptidase (beta-lactamase class C family)
LSLGAAAIASSTFAATAATAEETVQGLSADRLATIPPMIQQAIDVGSIPGVVSAIWRRGNLVQCNTLGARNIEQRLPMERTTLFRIASMSKPITTAAAMRLIESGKMKLDDPIEKWAPEFSSMRVLHRADGPLDAAYPVKRSITIEDLLTHRSGLAYGFMSSGPLAKALNEKVGMGIESSLSPDEWLRALASAPLAYAPGERFNYGHSTDVLGFIVGRAMGTTFRDALRKLVLDPLGMLDTDFWIPPTKRDRAAVIYAAAPSGKGHIPVEINSFVGATAPAFTSAGQGLVSTLDDYLTFAQLLLRKGEANGVRLLKPETVELMTRNRLTAEQRKIPFLGLPLWNSLGFGLGVSMIMNEQAHAMMGAGSTGAFGWPGMFGGWWQADPKQDLILIWLTQMIPSAAPVSGEMPPMPGVMAQIGFQKQVYTALRN